MKINYVILAHKQPKQLKRLINRLDSADSNFYIHINKLVEIQPFKKEFYGCTNVHFVPDSKREKSIWGDIGLVKATLQVFEQIIEDNREGFCIVLSGQDYPLRSNDYISTYLDKRPTTNFISIFPFPAECWPDGGMKRLTNYKVNRTSKSQDYVVIPSIYNLEFYSLRILKKLFSLVLAGNIHFYKKIKRKRKYPKYLKPYGGDFWCALPLQTVKSILEYLSINQDYLIYHEDSLLPDETFLHSIIMSLSNKDETVTIMPTLTYVRWASKYSSSPVTFTSADIKELSKINVDKLFARKFDIEADESVLDLIDTMITVNQFENSSFYS